MKERQKGLLLLLPTLAIMALFTLYPMFDGLRMAFTNENILRDTSEFVELALNLIQKVVGAGVRVVFLGVFSTENAFAFTGVPNAGAGGFGDLNDPEVGGEFASLQITA